MGARKCASLTAVRPHDRRSAIRIKPHSDRSAAVIAPTQFVEGPDKSSLAHAMERSGLRRVVRCSLTDTTAIPQLIGNSDLVATVYRRLAQDFARRYDLDIFDLPISLPAIRFHLIWHERYDADAGHRWLRELIKTVCARL